MNILWLSQLVPYPPTGLGVLQRSYNLIRELAGEHRVYLLGFVQRKPLEEIFGDPERGLKEAYAHLRSICAEVEFMPIPVDKRKNGRLRLAARSLLMKDPYTINWMKSASMHRTARAWRARHHFDLVHFDTISLAPYLPDFLGLPITVNHHNIESHMMLRRAKLAANPLERAYFWQEGVRLKRYEQRVCRQFDMHLTCSTLDTARLRHENDGLNVVEIPNGVDIDFFRPSGAEREAGNLVFAGNLGRYPNAAAASYIAERVWPLLQATRPGVTMHIIGANPSEALKALSQREPRFKVLGFVPDVRPYLDRAEVYVCPITDGGGTKLKVLDALAMGSALVADPIACEGIDVKEGETVLFAREPEDYVRQIVRLLENKELRARMGAAARQLVEDRFSYESIGTKLDRVMTDCAEVARSRVAGAAVHI
ncbi:MAG: glycosyltransferase [Gemmatimonadaceae bacterium]|nr:glycosyltransferase [Gemmatimonadaceae bacterium]